MSLFLDHIDPNRASCSKAQHPHVDYNKFTWQNDLLFYKGVLSMSMMDLLVLRRYNIAMTLIWLGILGFKKP